MSVEGETPNRKDVLIVDDDAKYSMVLAELVRQDIPDSDVHIAADAEQAQSWLDRHKPDAIIVDELFALGGNEFHLVHGGMKVVEMVRARSETKDVPIFIHSAVPEEDLMSEYAALGVVIIPKPMEDVAQSLKEINRAIHSDPPDIK